MDIKNVFSTITFISATIVLMFRECYTKGVVSLDVLSFDKVMSKFPLSVVKFDVAYPYGKKEDAYNEFAQSVASNDDLLVASVGVKDYGEMDNVDLASRFGVNSTDFPVVKMFIKGKKDSLAFDAPTDESFTKENLISFVRRHNKNIYIGASGCVQELDKLAAEFSATRDVNVRKELLSRAEKFWDESVGNQAQRSAQIYVKLMRKVLEVGDDFLNSEKMRLSNILKSGSVSDTKKVDISNRMNIIDSFAFAKDEL